MKEQQNRRGRFNRIFKIAIYDVRGKEMEIETCEGVCNVINK